MLLRRLFERVRTRSSNDTNKQTCLCTTAKRDSLYDDPAVLVGKNNRRQSVNQYDFVRKDKSKRLMRQISMDESDGEENNHIIEKLRCASSQSPANIPMLVVISFNPDAKGLQKKQIEIQRGFPVNALYILNEWLFIKTADNEEGFVPYLCCRPIFRHQSMKYLNNIENSSFDIQSNKISSTNLRSSSYLFKRSLTYRKRQDMTTSSCGGDSGVSDCESSINNHLNSDLLNKSSLNSSSNMFKKTGLIVKDLPLKKSNKPNQIKSQLSISSNSAFTQFVKKNQRQESVQQASFYSNNRLFNPKQKILLSSSSFNNNFHRRYASYEETTNVSSPSSKYLIDNNNIISTPTYVRRSLPHHTQSVLKKPSYNKSSSHPFKIIKEQQLRNIVHAEPSLPPAIIPSKSILERHFSDLSLNQIENDSFTPSTPLLLVHNQPSSSYTSSSSSSSTTSTSTDDSKTPFVHIQMNNYRTTGRIPVIHTSSNINNNNNNNTQPIKTASFIHNVSITV